MSLELSPSQERRLHSILDRGLDTLQESVENISRSTPGKYNWSSNLEGSYRDIQKFSSPSDQTEKSKVINSELKSLQSKLATLEAKLSKGTENTAHKPIRTKAKSPANYKYNNENSPRVNASGPKRYASRDKLKDVENSEKEIKKMERSITPSPARYKSTIKRLEKPRAASIRDRKGDDRIKRENEILKKEIAKVEEYKNMIVKLQEDYKKLTFSYERSETIRKKQKELINHLKIELKGYGDESLSDSIKVKLRNHKIK
jgi:hypothetical protein